MILIKEEETQKINNSDVCIVWEYPMNETNINYAKVELTGRYPSSGYAVNEKCKELIYVLEGEGRVTIKEGDTINFKVNDTILIDCNEIYCLDGKCKLLLACTPSWNLEQYKLIN